MNNELFVDIRTDEERDDGHLDSALHFELVRLNQGELLTSKKIHSLLDRR